MTNLGSHGGSDVGGGGALVARVYMLFLFLEGFTDNNKQLMVKPTDGPTNLQK